MGDKNFRLPSHVRPLRYAFDVTPSMESGRFSASGTIELELDTAVSELVLHGVQLDIASARIGPNTATVSADADSQTLTFAWSSPIGPGRVTLEVAWTGAFQSDLRGLYKAGPVAVTQFEAADARRVFPCFDEPAFKAIWELAIVAPAHLAAISNGAVVGTEALPGGLQRVKFAPTPRMSSYLVAMVVGPLVPSSTVQVGRIPLTTWAVADKAHLSAFGQDCAAAVLPLLESYFGLPYAFGKVDQVGIPDFEAGAMENSGCITYREIVLLVDPAQSPLPVLKRVAEVITHELAHQWFGNLVTMQWWDDLWLNEAFATWMAYKIVDQWKPGWRMWDDFEQGKAMALGLDALDSTHPIHTEVLNADQATENFDVITYEKGGAMLRMLEGYLGADHFRQGIRNYMKKHAFGNARADDLWGALGSTTGAPIVEVANAWIKRGGFPLVSVELQGNTVHLRQRPFHADPARFQALAEEPLWPIPVVVRWEDDTGVHDTPVLFSARTASALLPATGAVRWVHGNRGGAGFYRVQYAPAGIQALSTHWAALSPVERVGLLADTWALFRAGATSLASVLPILDKALADSDYTVVGEAVTRLDALDRRCATEATRAPLHTWAAGRLTGLLEKVGFGPRGVESDDARLHRAAVLRGLALVVRRADVVGELGDRLRRVWQGDGSALDPNLLDTASVATARGGDVVLFEMLLSRLAADPDPAGKRRGLVSLASVESPALVDRALALFLTDTVPMQDATVYVSALLGNRAAQDKAWAFLQREWDGVRRKTAAPMLTRRLVEALGELVHKRAEVEAFLTAHEDSLQAVPAALRQTRERLRLDEDMMRRGQVELAAWLQTAR